MTLQVSQPVDGERFLLDLLNSTPIVENVQQDALGSAASARDWLRAHGGTGSAAERAATTAARDVLQDVVRGHAGPGALAPLLSDVVARPSISDDGVGWSTAAPPAQRLALRGVLAWDELHRAGPGRLRPCGNPECALFLIDHSRPNNARWCSMAVCGNRMKARRHYERSRAAR